MINVIEKLPVDSNMLADIHKLYIKKYYANILRNEYLRYKNHAYIYISISQLSNELTM